MYVFLKTLANKFYLFEEQSESKNTVKMLAAFLIPYGNFCAL